MISQRTIPVMGYNTFNGYGWSITEQELKDNALFVDKELKPFGYTYITLDFMWSTPGRDNRDNPDQNEQYLPWRNMDRYGRLVPAPDRFPSSVANLSLKPIADYLHGRELKFGLHVMCGVPKQAVASKCVIKGTEITCDQIVSSIDPCCTWNNEMYPIDFSCDGAQAYVDSLLEQYTEWEVDLLKIDDLSFPYRETAVEAYGKAIADSPREIVFSTSPGATPLSSGEHVSKWANMWRISPDFWDMWDALLEQIDRFESWKPFKKGNAFSDGDMIPVSQLSNYGPWEAPRYSNFTIEEKHTLLSVWSLMNSPLIVGGDLTVIDSPTLALLQNTNITLLDRFARNATVTHLSETLVQIAADVEGQTLLRAIAYINIGSKVESLPCPSDILVNVWGTHCEMLAPHDTALYITSTLKDA